MKVQLRVQLLFVHSSDGQSAVGAILIRVFVLILIFILLFIGSSTNQIPIRKRSELMIVTSKKNRNLITEKSAVALPEFPIISMIAKPAPTFTLANGLVTLLTTRSEEEA